MGGRGMGGRGGASVGSGRALSGRPLGRLCDGNDGWAGPHPAAARPPKPPTASPTRVCQAQVVAAAAHHQHRRHAARPQGPWWGGWGEGLKSGAGTRHTGSSVPRGCGWHHLLSVQVPLPWASCPAAGPPEGRPPYPRRQRRYRLPLHQRRHARVADLRRGGAGVGRAPAAAPRWARCASLGALRLPFGAAVRPPPPSPGPPSTPPPPSAPPPLHHKVGRARVLVQQQQAAPDLERLLCGRAGRRRGRRVGRRGAASGPPALARYARTQPALLHKSRSSRRARPAAPLPPTPPAPPPSPHPPSRLDVCGLRGGARRVVAAERRRPAAAGEVGDKGGDVDALDAPPVLGADLGAAGAGGRREARVWGWGWQTRGGVRRGAACEAFAPPPRRPPPRTLTASSSATTSSRPSPGTCAQRGRERERERARGVVTLGPRRRARGPSWHSPKPPPPLRDPIGAAPRGAAGRTLL
jgi:hypothetical protein